MSKTKRQKERSKRKRKALREKMRKEKGIVVERRDVVADCEAKKTRYTKTIFEKPQYTYRKTSSFWSDDW